MDILAIPFDKGLAASLARCRVWLRNPTYWGFLVVQASRLRNPRCFPWQAGRLHHDLFALPCAPLSPRSLENASPKKFREETLDFSSRMGDNEWWARG